MPEVLGASNSSGHHVVHEDDHEEDDTDNMDDDDDADVSMTAAPKSVRFSPDVIEHEPSIVWDLEDHNAMWWSQEEISNFSRTARSKAHAFLRKNEAFTRTFHSVFQDCSKEMSSRRLLQSENVQDLLGSATALRGLESRMISIIRQYRKFHITSVLEAAEQQDVQELLRARSLRTSRPSRALARILARQDSMATAHMIQKELDGEPPSPSSSASSSGEPHPSDPNDGGSSTSEASPHLDCTATASR
ncbi:MAG: hypothetical protein SGILL_007044 [Bacillariaceae sp.]